MRFQTGEVEALLDLPASTLRFWEKEVPFLAPRKDVFGRRVYTALDLCTILRLKHLALASGMGLKSACAAIEREMTDGDPTLRASLLELKIELITLAARARRLGDDIADSGEPS